LDHRNLYAVFAVVCEPTKTAYGRDHEQYIKAFLISERFYERLKLKRILQNETSTLEDALSAGLHITDRLTITIALKRHMRHSATLNAGPTTGGQILHTLSHQGFRLPTGVCEGKHASVVQRVDKDEHLGRSSLRKCTDRRDQHQ